jgi:alkylhydroperoxidase/carboxymuconolactone decarboxylase family protein YurZ
LGATEEEIAETLDIGLLMGGSLAIKSVRHAFWVMEELRGAHTPDAGV